MRPASAAATMRTSSPSRVSFASSSLSSRSVQSTPAASSSSSASAAGRSEDVFTLSPARSINSRPSSSVSTTRRLVTTVSEDSHVVSRSRPSTAPMRRATWNGSTVVSPFGGANDIVASGEDTPFQIVTPYLPNREVLIANNLHRTYSAGGKQRCPRNKEFIPPSMAWGIGPGSYSLEKPDKHTPSFFYKDDKASAISADTADAINRIRAGSYMTESEVAHIAPKRLKAHEMKGPLIAMKFASTHQNHSREEALKAQLALAVATPTVATVNMLTPESDFSMKNSIKRGAHIPVGDIGFRSRKADPKGPTLSESIRPEWEKLATYVPPMVRGPMASFSDFEYSPELDPDSNLPVNGQARLKELAAKGYKVKNFVQENWQRQKLQTFETKKKLIENSNQQLDEKQRRARQFLNDKQKIMEERYLASALNKDIEVRQERANQTRVLREQQEIQKEWLRFVWVVQAQRCFLHRLDDLLWEREKLMAGRKILRAYRAWKKRMHEKMATMRQKKVARRNSMMGDRSGRTSNLSMQLLPHQLEQLQLESNNLNEGASPPQDEASSISNNTPGTTFLTEGSGKAEGDEEVSLSRRRTMDFGALVGQSTPLQSLSPRSNPSKPQKLQSLLAMQTNEANAGIIADFLDTILNDPYRKLRQAMATFMMKVRRIQAWWRNHLLAMQWRLHIQTLQFFAFRDRSLKQEQIDRLHRAQDKMALFNKNLSSNSTLLARSRAALERDPHAQALGKLSTPMKQRESKTKIGIGSADNDHHSSEEKESSIFIEDDSSNLDNMTNSNLSPYSSPRASSTSSSNPLAPEDRSNPVAVSVQVFKVWAPEYAEAMKSGELKRPVLRKFVAPLRASMGANLILDKTSQLVQWNILARLMREVFNQRLRLARRRFRNWLKQMRLQGVKEDLLAFSGTVKPLTQAEKEKLSRGELPISTSEHGGTASGTVSARGRTHASGNASDRNTSRSPLRRLPSHTQHTGRKVAGGSSTANQNSFLSRLTTPNFFRLFLTDAELYAVHRGVNLLINNSQGHWFRDASVHSVHFITTRVLHSPQSPQMNPIRELLMNSIEEDEEDEVRKRMSPTAHAAAAAAAAAANFNPFAVGTPIFIGQKYALKQAAALRLAIAIREGREAELAAIAAAQQAERAKAEERLRKVREEAESANLAQWPEIFSVKTPATSPKVTLASRRRNLSGSQPSPGSSPIDSNRTSTAASPVMSTVSSYRKLVPNMSPSPQHSRKPSGSVLPTKLRQSPLH